MKQAKAILKAIAEFILLSSAIIILPLMNLLGLKRYQMQKFVYSMTMKITGVKVKFEGKIVGSPALLVSNHQSYLDVIALGAIDDFCFTPKLDVASWPVVGFLVKEFDVIFVSRERNQIRKVQKDLIGALEEGRKVFIFPEGTTNNGRSLETFKPSLFSIAEWWKKQNKEDIKVQPVSVIYETLNGEEISGDKWDIIAWYGDMEFFSHLWQFLVNCRSLQMKIIFHEPVTIGSEGRKTLAANCEDTIRYSLPSLKAS